jgi:hypothetical protein
MTDKEYPTSETTLQGLNCPKCGGVVPVPEGQLIVRCPYCELRSFVRGERGLLRYQVPQHIGRQQAIDALHKFLSSNPAIAPAAARQSQLREALPVHLPFWTIWARTAAWVFGEKQVGSGDNRHYEPREVRVVQDMTWNGAACDVGELGVPHVPPVQNDLQPFNPQVLHDAGMVFEPLGSFSQAWENADQRFQKQVEKSAALDRVSQTFVRGLRRRDALVYHPLWVLRYLFRGRAFQVVVDGYTGKVLYGKAPGNTLYRAAVLVFGMAVGAFLAIDVPAFLLYISGGKDNLTGVALAVLVAGIGVMAVAYRTFRHGEQYEYRAAPTRLDETPGALQMISASKEFLAVKDIEKWINELG